MASKESAKTEGQTKELPDEQLDQVAAGADLKLKTSPDNIRKLKSSPDSFRDWDHKGKS